MFFNFLYKGGKVINAIEKRQEKINKYNQENQIESENEL